MNITKTKMTQLVDICTSRKKTPFIVEVLGTPNSGKTTAIQAFEKVLRRNCIKCKIIYEAAGRCKIKNKFSPEFNLWTLNETIKQLLEAYAENFDIIVCERGLLDAICWCNLYYHDDLMDNEAYNKVVEYILLKRLINRIECEIILKCTVEESLCRENTSNILEVAGTIVNEEVLTKYNLALERVKEQYANNFERIVMIDTTELSQKDINRAFVSAVFDFIKYSDN